MRKANHNYIRIIDGHKNQRFSDYILILLFNQYSGLELKPLNFKVFPAHQERAVKVLPSRKDPLSKLTFPANIFEFYFALSSKIISNNFN